MADDIDIKNVDIGSSDDVYKALDKIAAEGAEEVLDHGKEQEPGEEGSEETEDGTSEEKRSSEGGAPLETEGEEATPGEEEPAEEPEKKADQEPEEPADHGERSRMGRKIARMEEGLQNLQATIAQLVDLQVAGAKPIGTQEEDGEDEYFEPPQTKAEFDKMVSDAVARREAAARTRQANYQSAYTSHFIKTSKDLSPEDAAAVWNIMVTKFRETPTGNPSIDSELAFNRAQLEFLKATQLKTPEKKDEKVNPLSGGKPRVPLGSPPSSKPGAPVKKAMKLDPVAADFARRTGMSDEDVSSALGKGIH